MLTDPFVQLSFFQGFSPQELDLLRPLFIPCEHTAGDILFSQGDPAGFLYLLMDGEVVVRHRPDDGPDINVAHVRPEGAIGWSAALGNPAYTSSAICTSACQTLRIDADSLRRLYEQCPEVGSVVLEKLVELVSQRLSQTYRPMADLLAQGMGSNSPRR